MATTTQTMEERKTGVSRTGWIFLIVLVLVGLGVWIYQLVAGMGVTGLGQQVVWGLYIAAFFTAAAAGAGLLALVGVSEFRPMIAGLERLKLLAMALMSFIITALLVLVDIGNPIQAWRIITALKFSAPMTWDFWALVIAGIVTLVYMLAAWRGKESGKSYKLLGVLGILAGLGLVLVEGVMLALLAARPMWGGLTLFAFLLGAAAAGMGLGLLVLGKETGEQLVSWLGVVLGASLLLVLADVIAGLLTGNQRGYAEMLNLLIGTASLYFWTHVIVGLLVPLILVASRGAKLARWIGGLVLVGVVAEKQWMLAAGQAQPWLAMGRGSYAPTWVEILVVIGMVALAWLLYLLVTSLIHPKPEAA